ncbi:MAG TPA: hypothetical protein VHQ43_08975 [Solirubrobacterales bacterium]|jgi:hypothetical protein|nr:hypothetical protein [Solirubrobacterales bacterium]
MVRLWLNKRTDGAGSESGLTIVEVLVAAIVLVLGAAATFGILAAAARNGQRAKATQVALDLAQEELERLHGIPYENLAVSSQPKTSTSVLNPAYRVKGSEYALKRSPLGEYGQLVIDAEKGISPESEFFSGDTEHGGIKGTLFRYVVWRNDPSCPDSKCPGAQDYKQIVVAVKPDKPVSQSGDSGYVEVQSQLTDPEIAEAEGGGGPEAPPGPTVTAQQFYLSDTACAANGKTTRAEITGDHLLHNTLGTCASGLRTGTTLGAPDALLLSGPPDPAPEDPALPALHDYSDDFYLEPTPDTDKGVQIRRDDTPECHYDPTGTTNPESQVHRWVTDPMPSKFEMGGKATLEFYTRTLNDALYTGALCVYLFDRSEEGSPPVATDTRLTKKGSGSAYWVYEPEGTGFWPRNVWTKVRLTMEFEKAPHYVEKNHRLGIALSVDRAYTPADAIPIMYDHPDYPTRIEVDSLTPLAGG